MNIEVKDPIAVVVVFVWIGFVAAISFMEAWLKFRAPGVSLPIGLGIGRLVFNALNKVEWMLAASIFVSFFLTGQKRWSTEQVFYYIPVVLLLVQTVLLLPGLDHRAEMHIRGESVRPSFLHIYYVAMEVVKLIGLFIYGIKQFTHS